MRKAALLIFTMALVPRSSAAAIKCETLIARDRQIQPTSDTLRYRLWGSRQDGDERCEGKIIQNQGAEEKFVIDYAVRSPLPSPLPKTLRISGAGLRNSQTGQVTLLSRKHGYRLDTFLAGRQTVIWPSDIVTRLGINPAELHMVGRVSGSGPVVYFPVRIHENAKSTDAAALRITAPYSLFSLDVYLGAWTTPGQCTAFRDAAILSRSGTSFDVPVPPDAEPRFCLRLYFKKTPKDPADKAELFFTTE